MDFSTDRVWNVLVLGRSQQGKSTFIGKLRELAEIRTLEAPTEGHGTIRQTTEVTAYKLTLSMTTWELVSRTSGEVMRIPRKEDDLFNSDIHYLQDSEAKVVPQEPNASRITLRLIDTPGLDDSEGDDGANIIKVLTTLSAMAKSPDESMHYLHAIFFVTAYDSAFSDNFQKKYRYYERCMPNLFGGVAIINTKFSVQDWETAYSDQDSSALTLFRRSTNQTSSKAKVIQNRSANFAAVFRQHRRHFFIDSKPKKGRPFEEYLTRTDISALLSFVSSQGPMPITEMRLAKLDEWRRVDDVLIRWLSSAKTLFEDRKARLLAQASAKTKTKSALLSSKAQHEGKIAMLEEELRKKDSETEYTLKVVTTGEHAFMERVGWFLLGRGVSGELMIEEPEFEGFQVKAEDSTTGEWYEKSVNDETRTWTGKYKGFWGTTPSLEARSYTTNKKFYATEISRAKYELERCREVLLEVDSALEQHQNGPSPETADETDKPSEPDPTEVDITDAIHMAAACSNIIDRLRSDEIPWTEASRRHVLKRYKRQKSSNDSVVVRHIDLLRLARCESRQLEAQLDVMAMNRMFGNNPVVEYESGSSAGEETFEDAALEQPRDDADQADELQHAQQGEEQRQKEQERQKQLEQRRQAQPLRSPASPSRNIQDELWAAGQTEPDRALRSPSSLTRSSVTAVTGNASRAGPKIMSTVPPVSRDRYEATNSRGADPFFPATRTGAEQSPPPQYPGQQQAGDYSTPNHRQRVRQPSNVPRGRAVRRKPEDAGCGCCIM